MDDIDRKILAELQEDGRLTITELADRVRLTPAPCHRRLREMERNGVITGYRAVLDPAAVGLGFEALVNVTMDREDADTIAAFEAALAVVPEIRHAERLFGDPGSRVSGGGAWPTPRATNSTSTSSPARREDIGTRLRPAL